MKAKVLLFGGTFDPIHNGHLIIGKTVARRLDVDKIILIPSARPPHKLDQVISPAEDRLEMARLAITNEPQFEVSDCELQRQGPSYTLDTVRSFNDKLPGAKVLWLIGADTIKDLPTWYHIDKLVEECQIVTALRPGYEDADWTCLQGMINAQALQQLKNNVVRTPLVDVSASNIRQRVESGDSISQLVPSKVKDYIRSKRLYLTGMSSPGIV